MAEHKDNTYYLELLVKEEDLRKTFQHVFDNQTVLAVHELARAGYFHALEFVISTGKEAHVFRAADRAGNYRAVKIYKTKAREFKHMRMYIEGDIRFKTVKHNVIDLLCQWTKKEYKNLEKFTEVGVRVPIPFAYRRNVLVMEFIGDKGVASPTLKEAPIKDVSFLHHRLVDYMAKMVKAGLVHADLSEYNILNYRGEPVIIDCAQAVPLSHPHARLFFERDVRNVSNYLAKHGYKTSFEELYKEIKARKSVL
jgi:RIO kinase 1